MKKPFKAGAIYKLNDDCVEKFAFSSLSSSQCQKYYGSPRTAFMMCVTEVLTNGDCCGVMVINDGTDCSFGVAASERDLFTRLDNK